MKGIIKGVQSIITAIATVVNGIKMIIQFIWGLVRGMFQLVKLLATTVFNTLTLIGTLPPWLIAFATATLGVAVLYIIIGRSSGKNESKGGN